MKLLKGLYRIFISTKTTIILFFILIFFMLLGTIFPQYHLVHATQAQFKETFGEEKFKILNSLGLFDVFHSLGFRITSLLFFLNLFLCTLDGLIFEWGRLKRGRSSAIKISAKRVYDSLNIEQIINAFKQIGYKVKKISGDREIYVANRGFYPRIVSIIYHFGMVVMIFGLVLSSLTRFDGDVSLFDGQKKPIPTASKDMKIYKMGLLKFKGADTLNLESKKFWMVFWKHHGEFFVKDYFSHLVLYTKDNSKIKEKVIQVNSPLRYHGMTFYQEYFVQKVKLHLKTPDRDTTFEVETMTPFDVPGKKGKYYLGMLKVGKWFKYRDEKVNGELKPQCYVYHREGKGKKKKKLGLLEMGKPLQAEDVTFDMVSYRQGTGIYYKRDNGIIYLLVGTLIFVIGLFLRVFYPTARFSFFKDDDGKIYLTGQTTGIAVNLMDEIEKMEKHLTEVKE